MMYFLKVAPWADSYDFWIALFIMPLPLLFLIGAVKAVKSGVKELKQKGVLPGVKEWDYNANGNFKIWQTGQFWIAVIGFALIQLFFWAFLWPESHNVWFIK